MPANLESEDILYNLAYECEDLFAQLQEASQKTEPEVATIELWAEFQQRFAIWAAHIGVFARKSQCLDTRLRNHPDLQDLVARLLDIIRRSLQQCTIETSDQGEPGEGDSIQTAALKTIDDTLVRLNRLGVTIRQSGRGRFDNRAKIFAAGLDLSSFASLCANAVQALYPGAHPSLKDYLSKSMTDRYARMLFLDSRHKKLETRRELRTGLSPIHEIPGNETQTPTGIAQLAMVIKSPVIKNLSRPPPAPSQSDLSSVNMYRIRNRLRPPDEASTRYHKTSSIQVNQGNYPRPPTTNQGSSIFTCQWCSELLSKKTLSESDWRRHIDRDLKPYICLSEGCQEAHPAYPTFDEWFRHMGIHGWRWHQQVYLTSSWVCTICEFNRDVYSSPQALYSHLEDAHISGFTDLQLQAISRQSKTEQPRASSDCLLCCFEVEMQGQKDEAVFPKRRKGQSKQETRKSARKTFEMANPDPHGSCPEFSDTSSDSDGVGSHQDRRQLNKDHSETVARHVAVHLQVLMLLTLRFASILQDDDGDLDDDIKSDSVDIDEGNSASVGTDLGRLSHIASEADVTMEEDQDGNDAENAESAMDLDGGDDVAILEDDIPVPDTDLDLEFVPRQYDDLVAKNDKFLNKVIESGAYQSWRNEPPKAFEFVVTPPFPLSDAVLEEADRRYRESMIARKIANDEILFRQNTNDESVVDKWQRPSVDEVHAIVTPPYLEDKEEQRSPYDAPNADVMIDNEIYPDDIPRFRSTQGAADAPIFKSRDPTCERDRPLLNLVRPTPVASPVSELKVDEGAGDMNSIEPPFISLTETPKAPEEGEESESAAENTRKRRTERKQASNSNPARSDTEDEPQPFSQLDDVTIRLKGANAKLSSSSMTSDGLTGAEEDFSPRLKRVGHIEFGKVAKANTEVNKRQFVPPPASTFTPPSKTTAAAVGDDGASAKKVIDRDRHPVTEGERRRGRTREQEVRDEEDAQRRRLAERMMPRRSNTVGQDSSYRSSLFVDDGAYEDRGEVEKVGSRRRETNRQEEPDEEEAQRQRLAQRMMPRERPAAGRNSRRHRVVYDDGLYRWE